jgi:hypothetical protein
MRLEVKLALGAAFLAAAVPSTATADPPTRITVVSVFNPIGYGDNDYVNGQLLGADGKTGQPGELVTLEQANPPAFADWAAVAQATSDWDGYYSFKLHPNQTMQYRTNSQGIYSEQAVQVSVTPRIRLKASSAGRTSVRFSGTIAPAFADQSVEIQRQLPRGGWTRVTTARLKGGDVFSGRIRAHKTVQLRAFFAASPAYLAGVSNVVQVTPGRG